MRDPYLYPDVDVLINKDNILKNSNKINNNNIIDGMLNNILIIANIKNKFEISLTFVWAQ